MFVMIFVGGREGGREGREKERERERDRECVYNKEFVFCQW
jgi:hypothetical protein